ncbi:MAG: hypothetical protein J6T10_18595 [Methanobrevibacter sp.]|nr:hypothetical protein [Methanobrevibacter sp.]
MLIETKAQYEEIPDGTKLKIVLIGDDWEKDTGTVVNCIKIGDKLYEVLPSFYRFSERNDRNATEDFTFLVIKTPGDIYEV